MPSKKRLTPLSIMVCDTILALRSRTLLKVLFDPGSTVTFISRKCLLRHCKPCPVVKSRSVNTLAGSCMANEMVVLRAIRMPELDKNRVIEQHKALVFDGNIRYDLILNADFLTKSSINIKYSSRTIEWFNSELPMQDPKYLDNNDYLALAETLSRMPMQDTTPLAMVGKEDSNADPFDCHFSFTDDREMMKCFAHLPDNKCYLNLPPNSKLVIHWTWKPSKNSKMLTMNYRVKQPNTLTGTYASALVQWTDVKEIIYYFTLLSNKTQILLFA
jgi:hypothetical protein